MAEIKRLTPPLGAYGKYELKAPWPTVNNMSYRCVSLRRVEEFVKSGQDLFAIVYDPLKISREVFEADVALGVVIVGLLGTNGERIFVPDTYILKYPDQSAITLDYLVMSVDFGPQPSSVDLSAAMDEIKLVASKYSGIDPELINVEVHTALSTTQMSQEEYINAEDARQAAIANNETSEQIIARMNETIRQQQQVIEQLLQQNKP